MDFLLEQLQSLGNVRARKMFGEYALYCDEKVVALVCDDQLYLKPTAAGKSLLQTTDERPPYPGAKNYYWISGEYWDDDEWLCKLILATAAEIPRPKKKR